MAESFDPYSKWLGIAPHESPPNHYRLLGVPLFSQDHAAIAAAAEQRMLHLHKFENTARAALAQKLIKDCVVARACLLRPEKKAAYDQVLQKVLAARSNSSQQHGHPSGVPSPGQAGATPVKAGVPAAPTPVAPVLPPLARAATPPAANSTSEPAAEPDARPTARRLALEKRAAAIKRAKERAELGSQTPLWRQPMTVGPAVLVFVLLVVLAVVCFRGTGDAPPLAEAHLPAGGETTSSGDEPTESSAFPGLDKKPIPNDTKPAGQGSGQTVARGASGAPQKSANANAATGAESAAAKAADTPTPLSTPIDLLALIDKTKNGSAGQWSLVDGMLLCLPEEWTKLSIPYAPPKEYVLTAVIERKSGHDAFSITLPVGGAQTRLVLDGWDGTVCGLDMIEGKRANENSTTQKTRVLLAGKPVTVACAVRESGVEVTWNGNPLLAWTGDPKKSLKPLAPGGIVVNSKFSVFHITKLEIAPPARVPVVASVAAASPPPENPLAAPPADAPPLAPLAEKPKGPPDKEARKKALGEVKTLFEDDYARAAQPAGKRALVEKLIEQAARTADDPAARFVMLGEARSLAIELADPDLLIRGVAAQARAFDLNELEERARSLAEILDKAKPPKHLSGDALRKVIDANLQGLDEATAAEDFSTAKHFLDTAGAAARRAKDTALQTQIVDRRKDFDAIQLQAKAARAAKSRLAEHPEDAGANLVLGKYLWFAQGNSRQGLQRFSLGSDTKLKQLATRTLEEPSVSHAQLELGHAWWDAARAAAGREKAAYQAEAARWYKQALPVLTGIAAENAKKRIEEVKASEQRSGRNSLDLPRSLVLPLAAQVSLPLLRIEPCELYIGSPSTEAGREESEFVHLVRITRPYYIGVTEVTRAQWFAVAGGDEVKPNEENMPRLGISWHDCQAFVKELNLRLPPTPGYEYRLPTEAEWECACRAGTRTTFSYGDAPSSQMANFDGSIPYNKAPLGPAAGKVLNVGSYPPNPWGLYDMHGNVREWCYDWYSAAFYKNSPTDDPKGPEEGEKRVLRGGGRLEGAGRCRCAHRGNASPSDSAVGAGLRVTFGPKLTAEH